MSSAKNIIGRFSLALLLLATTRTSSARELLKEEASPLVMTVTDLPELRKLSDTDLNNFVKVLAAIPQIPYEQLPRWNEFGGYFSLQHPEWPPLPGNINHEGACRMEDFYLLDDLGFNYDAPTKHRSKIASLDPAAAGEVLGGNSSYQIDTSLLWLEITNAFNGLAYLNLHHATNQVYAIWSTTNLPGGWHVERDLKPTNGVAMPFSVPTYDRPNLFLRAQDWTGVDSDGDSLPDWWEWHWFENLHHIGTELDASGNALLTDYTNFSNATVTNDPNVIAFSIASTNFYVSAPIASVQLAITVGDPAYVSILVQSNSVSTYNPTNLPPLTSTNWLPLTGTNLIVALGATDGAYSVAIGLKGPAPEATETWHSCSIVLDRVPVTLSLTNPAGNDGTYTVRKPYLQLQGYATKQLASLSYDISNATGVYTN